MASDDLEQVRERARDIFVFRAPALMRFGEPLYRAVDAVTNYAYREGRQAAHDAMHHQGDEDECGGRGRVMATMADNKGLLSNLLTLAVSASAASGAAVTAGPLVPPLLAGGVVVLVVFVLLLRAFWSTGGDR